MIPEARWLAAYMFQRDLARPLPCPVCYLRRRGIRARVDTHRPMPRSVTDSYCENA